MVLNSIVISKLSYRCHACYDTCSDISKWFAVYNSFLRSMFKNGFEQMRLVSLAENQPSSNLVDRITKILKRVIGKLIFQKCFIKINKL